MIHYSRKQAHKVRAAVMSDNREFRQFALLAVALALEFTTMIAG